MLFGVFTAGTNVVAGAIPKDRVTWPLAHQHWQALTFSALAYDPSAGAALTPA
jgi:hypothetical protein